MRGGIRVRALTEDPVSFDPLGSASIQAITAGSYSYSKLLKYTVGTRDKPPTGAVEADAATGWETSPDGLRVTFKLRQGMKWDPRPPTKQPCPHQRGREVQLGQVRRRLHFTQQPRQRRRAVCSGRVALLPGREHGRDEASLPLRAAAQTRRLSLEQRHHAGRVGRQVRPAHHGPRHGTMDAGQARSQRRDVARPQPELLRHHQALLGRHSQHHHAAVPPALAQFETGALWSFAVKPEEVLRVKRSHPQMELSQDNYLPPNASWVYGVSDLPNSPFKDKRIRQAISLMTDRDSLLEVEQAPSVFEKEGFSVTTRWHNFIGAAEPWWLNPKDEKVAGPTPSTSSTTRPRPRSCSRLLASPMAWTSKRTTSTAATTASTSRSALLRC